MTIDKPHYEAPANRSEPNPQSDAHPENWEVSQQDIRRLEHAHRTGAHVITDPQCPLCNKPTA